MSCEKKDKFQKQIYKFIDKSLTIHHILNNYYIQFWKNIYYNDAFVFFKEAILFYKNNENGNFHDQFGSLINEYLYKGSCQYIKRKSSFVDRENVKTTSEDLCRLTKTVIKLLDEVYDFAPRTPFPLISFRVENRNIYDTFFQLKKGDIYKNLNYLMTSVYPFHIFDTPYVPFNNNIKINFILMIPEGSKAYYLHNPFFFLWDKKAFKENIIDNKIIAHQENELVLPRGSFWLIKEIIRIDEMNFIYIMECIDQPESNKMDKNFEQLPKIFYKRDEYEFGVNDRLLERYFEEEILLKIKTVELFQNYVKKNYIQQSNFFDKHGYIFKMMKERNVTSKKIIKYIEKYDLDFYKNPIIDFKEDSKIIMYVRPNQKLFFNLYKYSKKIKINFPIVFFNNECDKEVKNIRDLYFNSEFTASEIYQPLENINLKYPKQTSKHIFNYCEEYPVYFLLKLSLKTPIKAYDMNPNVNIEDPLKEYLSIGNFNLTIKKKEKINLSNFRYYVCVSGEISAN